MSNISTYTDLNSDIHNNQCNSSESQKLIYQKAKLELSKKKTSELLRNDTFLIPQLKMRKFNKETH
jgi:hypothetical protein